MTKDEVKLKIIRQFLSSAATKFQALTDSYQSGFDKFIDEYEAGLANLYKVLLDRPLPFASVALSKKEETV